MTKKSLTKAEIRRLQPVDIRKEHTDMARDVSAACRWFEKAMRLYGRRRVVARMRAWARGDRFDELTVAAWLDYLSRWRSFQDRHVIPWTIVSEPWFVPDNIALDLVFVPRAESSQQVAA